MASPDLDRGDARAIIEASERNGLLRNQVAYVLATSHWETAHTHKPVKEAYWLTEDWRKENLRYYPWYGRGYVQLTWKDNYKRAQEALGLGTLLIDEPDNALQPQIATAVIVVGMKEGWFTGKKLDDYITLQRSDFVGARRIVNGTDKATAIAALAMQYDKLLLEEGYGVEPTPPTPPEPPVVGIEELLEFINGMTETMNQLEESHERLEERVKELERWRKS
jgi:putative chitinase